MLKKTKSILGAALAVVVITTFSATVFASGGIRVVDGNPDELIERTRSNEVLQGAWPVGMENEAAIRAEAEAKLARSPRSVAQPRAGWYYIPYNEYHIFIQETKTWCGPAVVQSVLTVLNGSSPSQASIYDGVKYTDGQVYLDDMTRYVNARESKNNYKFLFSTNTSQSSMKNCLYSGIVSYGAPSMIGVTFEKGGVWRYKTNGHFLSVYGVTTDKSSFMIGDSWVKKYAGAPNSFYSVPSGELYTAFSAQNLGLSY